MSNLQSPASRTTGLVLGALGIAGGLGMLAAFVVEIPPAVNLVRIVLFYVGAIAVVLAVHPAHAAVSRRLAVAAAAPLVIANGLSLAWVLASLGRERPFAGDFGLVGFYLALAAWLAAAWFGLVALRIGVLWRPALVVLAVGSLLAIMGMDRLGLTSAANPTVFGSVGVLGLALNASAWAALGLQVALRNRRPGPVAGVSGVAG